jgi:DNA-binding transcriptional regulator LsrR (DeoR family)
MQDDLKQQRAEMREKILSTYAKGCTRRDVAEQCDVSIDAVKYAVAKARAAGDARITPRPGRPKRGTVYGVPRDLVVNFKAAAASRGLTHDQLRRRVLYVVTRDNLFDALEIGDAALDAIDVKARRQ